MRRSQVDGFERVSSSESKLTSLLFSLSRGLTFLNLLQVRERESLSFSLFTFPKISWIISVGIWREKKKEEEMVSFPSSFPCLSQDRNGRQRYTYSSEETQSSGSDGLHSSEERMDCNRRKGTKEREGRGLRSTRSRSCFSFLPPFFSGLKFAKNIWDLDRAVWTFKMEKVKIRNKIEIPTPLPNELALSSSLLPPSLPPSSFSSLPIHPSSQPPCRIPLHLRKLLSLPPLLL